VAGPLEGLKVVELAGLGASPFACMMLADLGADVLRCERGDPDAEASTTWDLLNRSRDSVALDLKSPAGRDLVLDLAAVADVLVEGFRPGVAERLGLGPAPCLARNERLVYARMTGFGQTGPLAARAGHDINYLAISGALWPIGRAGERPVPPLNLVGDFGGGALYLVVGVLAALTSSRATGRGQVVDASMVDGSASLMSMTHALLNAGYWREERGVNILDTGAHFYDVYETSDGRFVAVGAIEPKFYEALLAGLGLAHEELPPQMDRASWAEMKMRFAAIFATRSRDEWERTFDGLDACVTPVLSPREAAGHPYNTAREVFSTDDVVQPRPAPRFSVTPASISQPPRAPGSGTAVGLARWGVSAERLARLRDGGAFG
jgi:alpha-methylacyl-CoA racemase